MSDSKYCLVCAFSLNGNELKLKTKLNFNITRKDIKNKNGTMKTLIGDINSLLEVDNSQFDGLILYIVTSDGLYFRLNGVNYFDDNKLYSVGEIKQLDSDNVMVILHIKPRKPLYDKFSLKWRELSRNNVLNYLRRCKESKIKKYDFSSSTAYVLDPNEEFIQEYYKMEEV